MENTCVVGTAQWKISRAHNRCGAGKHKKAQGMKYLRLKIGKEIKLSDIQHPKSQMWTFYSLKVPIVN